MTTRLSVVVPCYNEEKNIPKVLGDFSEVFKNTPGVELILVDNGSRDKTGEAIDRAITAYPFARKVTVEVNQGYGYGILQGLKAAQGDCLGWTHADLQTDPADVLRAYRLYQEECRHRKILVKGRREARSWVEAFLSYGMQLLCSMVLGVWLEEVNAQPKLFPRALYQQMKDPPHDFSLDLYLLYLAKKKEYYFYSIPVYFRERQHGEAKGGGGSLKNRWNLIKRTFHYIFELKRHVKQNPEL